MNWINKIISCIKNEVICADNPNYAAEVISNKYKKTGLSCFYTDKLQFRFAGNNIVKFAYPFVFTSKVDFINDGAPSIRRKSFAALDNYDKYNELKNSLDGLAKTPIEMEQEFNEILTPYKF